MVVNEKEVQNSRLPPSAGRILGSLDNVLAEVVEGNHGMVTPGFPKGVSAASMVAGNATVGGEGPSDGCSTGHVAEHGHRSYQPRRHGSSCSACHSRTVLGRTGTPPRQLR